MNCASRALRTICARRNNETRYHFPLSVCIRSLVLPKQRDNRAPAMPDPTTTASGEPYFASSPRLRRFAFDLALTTVFNLIIALFITYVLQVHDDLRENAIISLCIGTLMVGLVSGMRLMLWGLASPPRLPFITLFVAALPIGLFIGTHLASAITGIPAHQIISVGSDKGVTFPLMLLVVCAAITWFFWNKTQVEMLKAEAEAGKARAAAIEKQAMQAQLQLLQAQIEPHMLFNTLANLQGLIAIDPPRAQLLVDQLVLYLRATLSASRAATVTLAHEFALLDAYLGLMQVRMGQRLAYWLDLPKELDDLALPPMLLQPLVENAIKHGLEPQREGGTVAVRAQLHDGLLEISVADTGPGIPLSGTMPSAPSSGTGLANVRERLQAMFGTQATLRLENTQPNGVCATLTLPTAKP